MKFNEDDEDCIYWVYIWNVYSLCLKLNNGIYWICTRRASNLQCSWSHIHLEYKLLTAITVERSILCKKVTSKYKYTLGSADSNNNNPISLILVI